MDDTEIFARGLVARLGEQAHAYALTRASQFCQVGDEAGQRSWEEVSRRVKDLRADFSKRACAATDGCSLT